MLDNDGLHDFEDEETDTDTEEPSLEELGEDSEELEDDVDLKALLEAGDYEDEEGAEEADTPAPDEVEETQSEPDAESEAFKNEENARNAERRRQNEQRMLDKLRAEAPEFALAQHLAQRFGKPVDELLRDINRASLEQEAQATGVPVEVLEREAERDRRIAQLEHDKIVTEYTLWQNRVSQEAAALKTEYPMLTDEDMKLAEDYILVTLKNPDVPLEEAVHAKFGKKILAGQREAARNEALAQASGRKNNNVIPPSAGKSNSNGPVLDEAEKAAARMMGISEADYLKYK